MKLSCQQKEFLEALSLVQKAINPHNTLPILGNILLRAEGQKLYLSATNLEIAISTSFPAEIINEGKITLPAKILVSYVGYLKQGKLDLNLEDGETLALSSEGSKTKLKGISAEDFPTIPVVEKEESFSLEAKELKRAIEAVVFCAASSTTRPVLSGVYLWGKEKEVHFVATDSFRLGEKKVFLKEKTFSQELKSIIPAKTMQELSRILSALPEEEVEIICSKNQILFRLGSTELISRLIEGKFPEYSQIIPKSSKTEAQVPTQELILGIKRVGLFARENNNNIKFSFSSATPSKIKITTDATEIGSEESEIHTPVSGQENIVALNGQYFLEVLQNINDEHITIRIEEKLAPVVIIPEKEQGFIHVIMPLKV